MKILAFDVGGTQIKYGIVEDPLSISERGSFPTPTDSFDSFLVSIKNTYDLYKEEVEGIAMALPGIVNTEKGTIKNCGAMRYRRVNDLGGILEELCGCRVVLENDGKAAALAEYRCGSIQDCQNAAVFLVGTGVGGGLIINGRLVRGPHDTAGEFSFVNTGQDNGTILGNRCSTSFLLKTYKEKTGISEEIDGYEFFRRLPEDPYAKEALEELSMNIALALYNLYWLLDLEKVAIGGGISKQAVFIETVRKKFEEVVSASFTQRIRLKTELEIVPCTFHNDANLIGSFITYASHKGV